MLSDTKVVLLKPEFEEFVGSDDADIPLSLSLQELMDTLQENEIREPRWNCSHILIN